MSELGDAVEALCAAVTDGDNRGPEALRAAGSPVFADHEVNLLPAGDIDHVIVTPRGSVRLSELEKELGPARPLPRRPDGGGTRTVLFHRTLPDAAASGADGPGGSERRRSRRASDRPPGPLLIG